MPYKTNADLPDSVKVLPDAAQSVFRAAFNRITAGGDVAEKDAMRQAWGAVKNAGYRKVGTEWKKTGDTGVEVEEILAMDADGQYAPKFTSDGYLVAFPRTARTGIQEYRGWEMGRPDMDVVRVYRPEDQVFHRDAVRSMMYRPMTNDHPDELVTPDNWKELVAGQTGGEVLRDKEFARMPIMLMDAKAIQDYRDGKSQLSWGYGMDLTWGEGRTETGQVYDAAMSNIRTNHLALVTVARGGPKLNIGDREEENAMTTPALRTVLVDGLNVEMTENAQAVLDRLLKRVEGERDGALKSAKDAADAAAKVLADAAAEAKKTIDALTAEVAALKQKLTDAVLTPAKMDELVADRQTTSAKAAHLLGDKLVTSGKSTAEVRRQVVDSKLGDTAKGWSDDQVLAAFNALTSDVRVGDQRQAGDGGRAVLSGTNTIHSAADARDAAYDAYDKTLGEAWRNPKAA